MKYMAFLRAVNVSGSNMIKMPELKNLFTKMGFTDVSTYLQSGNVIFSASSSARQKLENNIEKAIHSSLGLTVKVIVRSKKDIDIILNNNPFIKDGLEMEFIHAAIFKKSFDHFTFDQNEVKKEDNERFFLTDECVYLYCPNGYGRTKLNNSGWEKWDKNIATTRNWKTMTAISKLME